METETFAALTASGRSPGRRRSRAEGGLSGLTETITTVLRGRNERTGSSGNVWRNWGYMAGLRQVQKERWRQPTGRGRSERVWLPETDTDLNTRMENFYRVTFLRDVNQHWNSDSDRPWRPGENWRTAKAQIRGGDAATSVKNGADFSQKDIFPHGLTIVLSPIRCPASAALISQSTRMRLLRTALFNRLLR